MMGRRDTESDEVRMLLGTMEVATTDEVLDAIRGQRSCIDCSNFELSLGTLGYTSEDGFVSCRLGRFSEDQPTTAQFRLMVLQAIECDGYTKERP